MSFLGGLTPAEFLRDYWQKKPLLVRGALPGFTAPLEPEELAGLACEEEVISRLILEKGGAYPWQLRYGPFTEEDFETLPETHWTLLVQEVDRHVPEVAALLDHVRFIPNWRLDDLMISFAPEGGGVGPHVDNYDVFLIQGLGHRRWRIAYDPVPPEDEHLVPDIDVSMLANFEADEEWVLAPGDLLYLPPRVPHDGLALDDCMTLSIGFRAPSTADLATGVLQHLIETLDPDARYGDSGLVPPRHRGEIRPEERARIRQAIRDLLADDAALDRWFGTFMTEPKRGAYPTGGASYEPEALATLIQDGARLRRATPTRYAFLRHDDGRATLFADGEAHDLPSADAAALLTGTDPLDAETLAPHLADDAVLETLAALVDTGVLTVEG